MARAFIFFVFISPSFSALSVPVKVVLEHYAESLGYYANFHSCVDSVVYRKDKVTFDDNFLEDIYNSNKVTHIFDHEQRSISFSCHDYLKTKHFKNLPDSSLAEAISYPVFHSKNIFGEYSLTLHEDAWRVLEKSEGSTLAEDGSQDHEGNLDSYARFSFKNRRFSEEQSREVIDYVERITGEPAYFDISANVLAFGGQGHEAGVSEFLSALDVRSDGVNITISFLKFSKNSLDSFIVGSSSDGPRSEKIGIADEFLKCEGKCGYSDFLNYVSGLKPASEPSSIFQLINAGLDLEYGGVQVTALTGEAIDFSKGSSSYHFNDGSVVNFDTDSNDNNNAENEKVQLSPYQVDTGFSLSALVHSLGEKYQFDYYLIDGDDTLTNENQNMSSSRQLSNNGKMIIAPGDERLINHMLSKKEVEEKEIMPILGYIPLVGAIFNSSKTVYKDQYAFYYVKIHNIGVD